MVLEQQIYLLFCGFNQFYQHAIDGCCPKTSFLFCFSIILKGARHEVLFLDVWRFLNLPFASNTGDFLHCFWCYFRWPKERATKPAKSRNHWQLVLLELVMTKVHSIKWCYNVLHHVAPNRKPNTADKRWWLEENPFHFLDGIRIDSVLVSAWGCSFHSKQQEL